MSWNEATATLAAALPGYEERAEQTRLATTIEAALADGAHLFGQAGCGTGKSFAYLIPAAFRARETRRPAVVATATKALQSQLAHKDLPFLQTVFPWLRFAVVKGRSNYVCKAKMASDEVNAVTGLASIRAELAADANHTGDVDDLVTPVSSGDRSKLTVIADECPGRRECPFGDVCYAETAKALAQDAHIVVANHSVLLRDTEIKNLSNGKAGMLPDYGPLVIDEAHELEDYATSALGVEFAQRSLERMAEDVATFMRDLGVAGDLKHAARLLFTTLDQKIGKFDETKRLTDDLLVDIFDALEGVMKATKELKQLVRNAEDVDTDVRVMAQKRMVRRIDGMLERLDRVMMADHSEIVRWIAREKRVFRGQETVTTMLAFAPLHVGPYLAKNLWGHHPAVLVSATLATDAGFDYVAGRLGVEDYQGFDAGSPFDFEHQAALYIPTPKVKGGTFPNEPKDDSYAARSYAEMGELVRASGGRALLLFTSRRAMNGAYEALKPMLTKMGVTILRQGDAPNGQLSDTFKDDETSVLFALKSFMTGADFQGDTLRLVIIDKMPFGVPTDVIFAARAEAIDAVKTNWNTGSFMQLSIPMATLTLLQAFGRGIRTRDDEALIAIFDPRLRSKGYGGGIMRTLPPAQLVGSLADATGYLGELKARRG